MFVKAKVGKWSATFIYTKHLFFHKTLQEISKTYTKSWQAFGNSLRSMMCYIWPSCRKVINYYKFVSCSWHWIQWETWLGFQWELDSCNQFSPHLSKAPDPQMNGTLVFLTIQLLWSVLTGFFMDLLQLMAWIHCDHSVWRGAHSKASLIPLEQQRGKSVPKQHFPCFSPPPHFHDFKVL